MERDQVTMEGVVKFQRCSAAKRPVRNEQGKSSVDTMSASKRSIGNDYERYELYQDNHHAVPLRFYHTEKLSQIAAFDAAPLISGCIFSRLLMLR
ncbi:hypothetical protein TNCV_20531 [Trichonephila clavipes]|uniref:Uncharacterized protein n=1 Tax=Trichonephila clavipes TaxID=2585209 RepID=A0A8X6RGP9_TRICX|nr:hypothetical protein TNCV_20531 [Trichonephila clavipes]